MKAYKVNDKHDFYSTIVFAETPGKARAKALGTDTCEDSQFIDIEVHRVPKADCLYTDEKFEIDWYNDADRLFMVKELGWACWEPSWECESCVAKQYCSHTMNSDEEVVL